MTKNLLHTLIFPVFFLSTFNAFSQCSGGCTVTNPAVLPALNPGVKVCITSNQTYNGVTTLNGGVISICNGSNVLFNGQVRINSGQIELNDCATVNVNGVVRNLDASGQGIVIQDACNCATAFQNTGAWFGFPIVCGGPLPVELLNFETNVSGNSDVEITWSTSAEINNSHFNLERSEDANTWENIARIEGAGNSNQTLEYSYTDINLQPGTYYYRLIQEDYDGTSEVFETKSVTINPTTNEQVSVNIYPSIGTGNIIIETSANLENPGYEIELVTLSGQSVLRKHVQGNSKSQQTLDISSLSGGMYIVRVYGNDFSQSEKLVISGR